MNVDTEDSDCSDDFYIMMSDETPTSSEPDGPYLTVTSPASGNFAQVGDEYTVEVS